LERPPNTTVVQRAEPGHDGLRPRQEAPPQSASHQTLSEGRESSVLQVNVSHPLPQLTDKVLRFFTDEDGVAGVDAGG
jgi:hypothetical protein